MLKQLAKIADLLDQNGLSVQADEVDRIISMAAKSDGYHMILARVLELIPKLSPHQTMELLAKDLSYNEVVSLMQEMETLAALSEPPRQNNFPAALNTFDPDAPSSPDDTVVMNVKPIAQPQAPTHWDDPNIPVPSIPSDLLRKLRDDNDWEEDEED